MLVLTRHVGETVVCTLEDGRRIEITITKIEHTRACIGIEAPKTILIDRLEIDQRKRAEKGNE